MSEKNYITMGTAGMISVCEKNYAIITAGLISVLFFLAGRVSDVEGKIIKQ